MSGCATRIAGVLGTALGLALACGPAPAFTCDTDEMCGGTPGAVCGPDGFCAFADETCESGLRYGDHSGPLTNACVPVVGETETATSGEDDDDDDDVDPDDDDDNDVEPDDDDDDPPDDPPDDDTGGPSDSTTGGPPGNPGGAPNGTPCAEHDDCESDMCFTAGILGGVCSECLVADDCPDGGCSAANPLIRKPAMCNQGELGGGCDTSGACADALVCTPLLDLRGIIEASTCSECAPSGGCLPAMYCEPNVDVVDFTGHWECVPPESLVLGDSCNFNTPETACASGLCLPASLMGVLDIGVCSECAQDQDCDGGACTAPQVDLRDGLIPGTCR